MLTDGLPSAVAAKIKGKAKRKQGKRYGHVTYQSIYHYQGVGYPINASISNGCYTAALSQMIRRIIGAVERYGRVLFIRFDLSMGDNATTSERLSVFLKQVGRYTSREYQTRLEYVWAREKEKAKCQHYHVALIIDGDKLCHPSRLLDELRELWNRKGGRLWIPENCYQMTERHNMPDIIRRVSYLAKVRGKGYRPDGARDFGWSRLIKTTTEQAEES